MTRTMLEKADSPAALTARTRKHWSPMPAAVSVSSRPHVASPVARSPVSLHEAPRSRDAFGLPERIRETLREILAERFSQEERRRFELVLRPLIESGQWSESSAIAYLTADRPPDP